MNSGDMAILLLGRPLELLSGGGGWWFHIGDGGIVGGGSGTRGMTLRETVAVTIGIGIGRLDAGGCPGLGHLVQLRSANALGR